MANITISTSVDEFERGGDEVLIQNLGPDMLYVGLRSDVSSTSGIQLDVFDAIELPGSTEGSIYMTSAGTSDVRTAGGIGIAAGSPSAPPAAGSVTTILGGATTAELSFGSWSVQSFSDGLVLSSAPAAGVTATVTASSTDPDVSYFVNPTTVTFTSGISTAPLSVGGSYSGSATSFVVTLDVVLASADTDFDGVTASVDLTVSVPVAQFSGVSGNLVEGGSAVSLSWEVNQAPTSDVTVNYSSTNPNVTFTSGTILTGASGTVTVGDVQIADNGIDDQGDIIPITATTSSADADYNGLTISFSAVDNPVTVQEVGLPGSGVFAPTSIQTKSIQGPTGSSTTFEVALGFTPSADVIVIVNVDEADFSVTAGNPLTFTTGNFATPQSVTVQYNGAETFASGNVTFTVDAGSADASRVGDVDNMPVFYSLN